MQRRTQWSLKTFLDASSRAAALTSVVLQQHYGGVNSAGAGINRAGSRCDTVLSVGGWWGLNVVDGFGWIHLRARRKHTEIQLEEAKKQHLSQTRWRENSAEPLGWEAEGCRFKPRCGQSMGRVPIAGGGARAHSDYFRGALDQVTKAPKCSHSALLHMQLGKTPASSQWARKGI